MEALLRQHIQIPFNVSAGFRIGGRSVVVFNRKRPRIVGGERQIEAPRKAVKLLSQIRSSAKDV